MAEMPLSIGAYQPKEEADLVSLSNTTSCTGETTEPDLVSCKSACFGMRRTSLGVTYKKDGIEGQIRLVTNSKQRSLQGITGSNWIAR